MKKKEKIYQDMEADTERLSTVLKKAIISRPAPLKPAKAKRQTSH